MWKRLKRWQALRWYEKVEKRELKDNAWSQAATRIYMEELQKLNDSAELKLKEILEIRVAEAKRLISERNRL